MHTVGEVDRYIEENNGKKYLVFASTDKNKEVLEKYGQLWDKPGDYHEKHMKIKFNLHDNLTLNKILELHNLTKIFRSVFEEGVRYYPQILLDECLYKDASYKSHKDATQYK